MAVGDWWFGEVIGVSSHCFGIGLALGLRPPAAVVLSATLEAVVYATTTVGRTSLGIWTLLLAPFAATVGLALASVAVSSSTMPPLREQALLTIVQIAAYMSCRKMAAATAYGGFPYGLLISLGTLTMFYLCAMAVLLMGSWRTSGLSDERLRKLNGLAAAFVAAHLCGLLVHAVLPSSWAHSGVGVASGIGSSAACCALLGLACYVYLEKGHWK